MKNPRKIILTFIFFFASIFMIQAIADPPGTPPDPPGHGLPGNQPGAPIDGGMGILMSLGAAYGIFKMLKGGKEDLKAEV